MRDLTIKEVLIVTGPVVVGITATLLALILTGHVEAALQFASGTAVLFGVVAWLMFLS